MTGVTIPFLDVVGITDFLAAELELAWKSVLTHGRFVAGPEVEVFEAEFARFCGATSCVGVGNGRSAGPAAELARHPEPPSGGSRAADARDRETAGYVP